jgi:hypothetical protein
MKNFSTCLFLLFFLQPFSFSYSQNNVWNSNSFKLSYDTISLENMAGATSLTFPSSGIRATDTISFPAGFRFHYGLEEFSQFSISSYGWMKFGAKVSLNTYANEDTIIVPFSNELSLYSCSYKITGAAPYRRFVVEWSGTFSASSSQPAKFQLWLYETNGRIDFVNQSLNAFTGFGQYNLFCRTRVLGEKAFAGIDVQTIPQPPLVNYAAVIGNNEGIPAKTRFTFQPDTVKPIRPGIQFTNILPGCFTVNMKDSSVNESFFNLEKKLQPNNYLLSKRVFSTTAITTGIIYTHDEIDAKPDSLYTFRCFVSNGFINSDTSIASLLTPMPLIFGVKTIPGDYPTINALLQDARCKHMGPNLVIELQPGYSFASEGGVVRFKPVNTNKTIRSITIRPAASVTSLLLNNTGDNSLFAIDSLPFVHIDGRAGGTGTTNVLTIRQVTENKPAIAYMNNANNGGVHYVNIEGTSISDINGLLFMGQRDPSNINASYNYPVNGASINNCKIGPSTGLTFKCLVIESGDSITIRENEFYRFFKEAVNFNLAGTGCRLVKNRIYQPDPIPSVYGTYSGNGQGAMVFTNPKNNFLVDSNRLGGAAAAWGAGIWQQDISNCSTGYYLLRVIRSSSLSSNDMAVMVNNEMGNIRITGYRQFGGIYVLGKSAINYNKFGTADSSNSIVSINTQLAIYANNGKSTTINGNFISGMSGNSDGQMVSCYFVDTVNIAGNDLGGSDNINQNKFDGLMIGIDMLGVKNMAIRKNEIHGLQSTSLSALGIIYEWSAYSNVINLSTVADSNNIHHLDGRRTIIGIFLRISSVNSNRISNNNIYALHGRGPSNFQGANNPTSIIAIGGASLESTFNIPSKDTGILSITGNRIYGMDYTSPSSYYIYPLTGIFAQGLRFRINNNMISLGTTATGALSDSMELACTGIDVYSVKRAEVEHNSIFIGGAGYRGDKGIDIPINNYANGQKDMFLSNNIIQMDRRSIYFGDNKYYISTLNSSNNSVVANNNIWYSNGDPYLSTKLQTWRGNCECDSNAIIADPKFFNPAGDSLAINLHLQALNPADSAGTPSVSPVPFDFDNDYRNNYSPVDIGADAVSPCAFPGDASITLTPYQDKIEICPGSTRTLTATPTGNLSGLQWQKNLNNIPGANGLTFDVSDPGSYRLVAKTACGLIASPSVFILTGISQPYIKLDTVTKGPYCDSTDVQMKIDHNHFSLTTLQYKWYRNNVEMPGKITDHETIEGIRYGDNIRAEVINTTPCGTTTVSSSINFFNVNPSSRPKVNIISYRDTLYNLTNRDTLKYKILPGGFGQPVVIYTSSMPVPVHSFVGDSLIIFTNVPFSFRFRLHKSSPGTACYYADTTREKSIYVSNTATPKTYTFTGNGNWNNPSNWAGNEMPPSPLPFNGTILINTVSGTCILNKPFTIGIGGTLTVASGSTLVIQGNLTQQ